MERGTLISITWEKIALKYLYTRIGYNQKLQSFEEKK